MDWEVREIEKYYLTKKDPKFLYKNVEHMTPQELRDIVNHKINSNHKLYSLFQFKKNFIPEKKTKEQLMNEIKYKKVWKDPGYCNGEFIPIKPLRGQVLNYWEMSRVTMPVRSYERYPVSKAIKNDLVGKEFGYDPTAKGTTAQYKKYLKEHNEKFKDFQYRPSKHTKVEKFLPQILLDKPPFYVKKSSFEYFNFPKHNTFLYENRFRTKK